MTTPLTAATGVFWWGQVIKDVVVSVPPQLGVSATEQYAGTIGVEVAPVVGFGGSGKSLAAFRVSVPPVFDFVPPNVAALSIVVPPSIEVAGMPQYSRSVTVSVPPVVGFEAAEQYPRDVTVSVPPAVGFDGEGVPGEVEFLGANVSADLTASVTLPTHQVGDLIVLFVYRYNGSTLPSKPSAGGTVPAWVDIDANTGSSNASRTAYFVATATNHTSGTWTSASQVIAAVVRNQAASPIGGHAEAGTSGTADSVAPAVTMTQTDGTSMLLHFHGHSNGYNIDAAPAGYTQRAAFARVALNTKNTTTTDGSVTQAMSNLGSVARGATVEIIKITPS